MDDMTLADISLLMTLVEDRIKQAEEDGIGPDHESSKFREDLMKKLSQRKEVLRRVYD